MAITTAFQVGPFILRNATIIATFWADLLDGEIAAPIDVLETKKTHGQAQSPTAHLPRIKQAPQGRAWTPHEGRLSVVEIQRHGVPTRRPADLYRAVATRRYLERFGSRFGSRPLGNLIGCATVGT